MTRQKRVIIADIATRFLMRVITHIVASFLRDIIAPIIEWHLWRVTRAITQVILHIVIADLVTRTLRRVISRMAACFFGVRHMRFKAGAFYGALFAI